MHLLFDFGLIRVLTDVKIVVIPHALRLAKIKPIVLLLLRAPSSLRGFRRRRGEKDTP